MKKILHIIGSLVCLIAVCTLVILASSLYNDTIKEALLDIGREALSVMQDFSKKAETNFLR